MDETNPFQSPLTVSPPPKRGTFLQRLARVLLILLGSLLTMMATMRVLFHIAYLLGAGVPAPQRDEHVWLGSGMVYGLAAGLFWAASRALPRAPKPSRRSGESQI